MTMNISTLLREKDLLSPIFTAGRVKISFQTSYLTVRENSTSVQLQLQSHGVHGKSSVSFTCNQVLPVKAEGMK